MADRALAEAGRLHRLGVEVNALGEPAVAARHLRRALRLLGVPVGVDPGLPPPAAQHAALAAKILTTLAHAEAEQGRTSLGFSLLLQCEALVAPADVGKLCGQRGLLLLRTGNAKAALAEFDRAVALIDAEQEPIEAARALLNRSVARMQAGSFAGARADAQRCHRLAQDAERPLLAVKALHNLGYCDLLVGDVPAALRTIGEAAEVCAEVSPSWHPVIVLDIARALLLAGLATDAAAEVATAIELFRRQRMSQDRAEAETVRAEAALLAGDVKAARQAARRARSGFRRRGNASGAAAAELVQLQAEYRLAAEAASGTSGTSGSTGTASGRRLPGRAFDLALRLRDAGLRHDAAAAELLGIRALMTAGRAAEATLRVGRLPAPSGAVPLDVRMLRYLTLAEVAAGSGERDRASRILRSGLSVLSRHRARLGSIDLQTGTAALGVDLAAKGLALSLTAGRPADVFTWSELSRAQALRIKPVRPPTDPAVAAAVAELRQLELSRRTAVMAGTPSDPGFNGRRAALERRIRQSAWPSRGAGTAEQVAGLEEVAAALAPGRQGLVSLFPCDGQVFAMVLTQDERRIVPLGPAAEIYETARRLRADITALVGRLLPSRMEKALAEAAAAHAEQLSRRLFAGEVASTLGDRELVVVPCGPLAALPWQLLPGLRGRPLSVAPSATSWLAALRAEGADGAKAPVLAAGPGLRAAGCELAAIASQYPDAVILDGPDAQVQTTLRALDGATMAHLAVHGRHEPDNVLFSRLELADGPLMAYDLLHLEAAPRHVVLSACDVGQVSMRPGEEPLGLAATLLHLGSRTVVAAAAPVGDAATAEVMAAYHRHLRGGSSPAQALAAATGPNPMAAFSCFGAG